MFLGIDVCSGLFAMTPQYMDIGEIGDIVLADGTYDHLYVSTNPDDPISIIDDEWTYDTRVDADYNGDSLDGGNSDFSLKNTDTIIIKRREKDKMNWVTIYTVPVNTVDDFRFTKEYFYARNETPYDFMIISSINNIENSYEIFSCDSIFEGLCIADKNNFYKTITNIDPVDMTRNVNNTVLELLHSKYPTVFTTDSASYDTGTVSAFFSKFDSNCDIVTGYSSVRYREEFMEWLTNKKPKILKLENGKIKMIQVTGTPTEAENDHSELQKITFDFVEIGNCDSEEHLYQNNLSDIEPDRW